MWIAETTEGPKRPRRQHATLGLLTKHRHSASWNLVCVAVTLACFTAGRVAFAEPSRAPKAETPSVEDDDSEWIQAGIAAYKKRDYAAARDSLIRAWEHSRLGTVAGILAESEMKLQRHADAAAHWTEYLRLLPEDSKTEREEAIKQLAICREHVGLVVVQVSPSDTSLVVDGAEILGQRKALHELWLPFGEHVVQARANEQICPAKTITVETGNDQRLDLVIPVAAPLITVQSRVVGPVATKPISVEHGSGTRSGLSTKTIVLITESALTVAALGTGIGAWFSYRAADHDVTELRTQVDSGNQDPTYAKAPCATINPNRPGACDALADRLNDRASTGEIVNIAMPAAGILAAVTVGTYFLWPSAKRTSERVGEATSKTLTVVPYWSPTNQGLTAQMRF